MNKGTIFFLIGTAVYLCLGIVVLFILDISTKRIRTRLMSATWDAHSQLLDAGYVVGRKMAVAALVFALWIFWPAAIYGAITGKKESK